MFIRNYGHLTKFESNDGFIVVDIPRHGSEWESEQSLQVQLQPVAGADYGVDPWGSSPAPAMPASERWRTLAHNTQIEDIRNDLQRIGRGRLWAEYYDGSKRWAWARAESIPSPTVEGSEMLDFSPIILSFIRMSDWYAEDPVILEVDVTDSPQVESIDIGGKAVTRKIVISITSNVNGGYLDPTILNSTTGEHFTISHDAGLNDQHVLNVLSFRLDQFVGGVYTDATHKLQLGGTQITPISFYPGTNGLRFEGVTNATVRIEAYPAWR